ncbi:MAG TPA: hypothetical protein VFZ73_07930 [Gemmatimonadaceae bacterium]
MPIPDDRLVDENDEDAVESTALPDGLDEADELEFESADADNAEDDSILDPEEADADTGFGFGDPAD